MCLLYSKIHTSRITDRPETISAFPITLKKLLNIPHSNQITIVTDMQKKILNLHIIKHYIPEYNKTRYFMRTYIIQYKN
ncbi:hypothetical protein Clim_1209 [Chlorobium limicola DSM 245]|uniref:Uncharacterized protein n=1 Tax=Chlorobium limicola (strain DSM 245 / NBRC 103803 / 6330) TaxID=290315 RepID=B3ECK1_CHLL2|nr:hypothetical protein Clim_1209 [Chlorobium limicola DSM 245]